LLAQEVKRVEKAPGADWTAIYEDRDTGSVERMVIFGQESILDVLFEATSSFGLFEGREPSECVDVLAIVRMGFNLSDINLLNHTAQEGYTVIYQCVATGEAHTEYVHTTKDIRSMLEVTKFKSVPEGEQNPFDFIDILAIAKLNLSHDISSHL
jgi:hypothetical protein